MSIEVKYEEGKWTPHIYFQRHVVGKYIDISTGFQFWRTANVGKVTPF